MSSQTERQQLRRMLREKRNRLSDKQQALNAQRIALALMENESWMAARRVALYFSADGEVETQNLVEMLWQHGKACYLPVIGTQASAPLSFAPWHKQSTMCANSYDIFEPQCAPSEQMSAEALDLVLVPLVGFDHHGNRLGMGGGFYDRTFAEYSQWSRKPFLVGLAHTLQYVKQGLPCEWWDVQLDAVITEHRTYYFKTVQ